MGLSGQLNLRKAAAFTKSLLSPRTDYQAGVNTDCTHLIGSRSNECKATLKTLPICINENQSPENGVTEGTRTFYKES